MNSDIDLTFKISIFGEKTVGKTSLITRFITNAFQMDTKPTLGAAIHVKYLKSEDKNILLQIWDFGGEEKFRFLLPSYCSGSIGAIYMYDISNMNSLKNFKEWISVFKSGLKDKIKDAPILLVGGKNDIEQNRKDSSEYFKFVLDSGLFINSMDCSSKTGKNVDKVFKVLLDEIMKYLSTIQE